MRKKSDQMPGMFAVDAYGDITANKHQGHPNSVAAHDTIQPHKDTVKQRVKNHLRLRTYLGATVHELAAALGCSVHAISGRLSELKAEKEIVETGFNRAGPSGSRAAVVVLPEYLAQAKEHAQ